MHVRSLLCGVCVLREIEDRGEPKTKHRMTIEERRDERGGFDTETAVKRILCRNDTRVLMDQYGCIHAS